MEEEILDFINRRFSKDCNWLNGNCYWFAKILSDRFDLPIYYDQIKGHFMVKDYDNNFYDWTGKITLENNPISFRYLYDFDNALYNRLVRDCIE